ncbi:OsmY domain-containing protein [Variovorax sp. WS11]|uniref:BON domain-containing protein n=1 Tax=Variovorax sp. WS11 TaxID=1105204 RepID=UPI000D0DAF66|nr:BON domain-containing protein [Variovorax sp. WS11]NDZ18439.1 BON domain-containing protein [Variovorax sp. WS11]PSL85088.1 OsmY domain-containing protein [Variovorax sp. WS11]
MKSDTQLRTDVLAELDWDPAIKAGTVGVTAKEGVVTLTGHLGSHAEKLAAERAAQRVQGVKALAVEITVKLPAGDERTDADIARAVEHALEWNVLVPNGKIKPMVEAGWVTLNGEVEWEYQGSAAENAVRRLMGVTGVSNLVKISPRVHAAEVEKKLREALARQAQRESDRIQISVDGSKVALRGSVHSFAESYAVQNAAWSVPGVTSVENDLVVLD